MEKNLQIRNSTVEFLTFVLDGKEDGVQVLYKDETIWATQKAMSILFDCSTDNVGLHLKNIFNSNELDVNSTTEKIPVVQTEGDRELNRTMTFYNLDAVISVGYRVNSLKATQFRQWTTNVIRQFAIRDYVIDKKRMENGSFIGQDYFEHLLAEIREIRLSERRFYQKLTDIYSTAIDYSSDAATTKLFFKKIQNKIHYAVHGHTAAELIVEIASAEKEHMGLTTWENAPDGKIVKPDVGIIAQYYLNELELEDMGRLVNAVLDMAERMAKRHIPMTMEDWANRIDIILEAGGDAVLDNAMMENFFGLMKSELLYLQEWDSVEQFAKELVKYIRYYNNDRIKLRLNGKSPVQYRALFQSKSASFIYNSESHRSSSIFHSRL